PRVFTERFARLVRPHGRRTERLESLLTGIRVLLVGEAGARLVQEVRVPVNADTILRLLYRMELAPTTKFRVVGIETGPGARVCDTGRLCATWRPDAPWSCCRRPGRRF